MIEGQRQPMTTSLQDLLANPETTDDQLADAYAMVYAPVVSGMAVLEFREVGRGACVLDVRGGRLRNQGEATGSYLPEADALEPTDTPWPSPEVYPHVLAYHPLREMVLVLLTDSGVRVYRLPLTAQTPEEQRAAPGAYRAALTA